MIPKISGFSQKEVKEILKKAKRIIKSPGLDILLCPSTASIGRILVITPKKTGNAPLRNKIRRRLKAIYYESKLYEAGYDCIIIIKKEGINLDFNQLQNLLFQAFSLIEKQ